LIEVTDQIGVKLSFTQSPVRIVSLVPSITETIADIDLEERIVGLTKFCIHPTHLRSSSTIIGGTKNPRIKDIISLKPDIIFANKEENRWEDIEVLSSNCQVFVTDIKTVEDTLRFLHSLTLLFNDYLEQIDLWTSQILAISNTKLPQTRGRVLYLIWKDPYMTVGKDTFIHHMLERYGFINYIDGRRYPILTDAEISILNPEVIFLSSEPFPFTDKHITEIQNLCPSAKIMLVDGEMFSWYGTRILKADKYLHELRKLV
jgi:ABC-type Fe3+-hydroxamate transport system substrate-binding protein